MTTITRTFTIGLALLVVALPAHAKMAQAPQIIARGSATQAQPHIHLAGSEESDAVTAVRAQVEALIQAGTTFDVEALEQIYHDDLDVVMIDTDDNKAVANKEGFKGLFTAKRDAGAAPLDTWAKWHRVTATDKTANVVMTRKVNLTGQDQILILSIDLIHEDGRWQVTREVIFARPDV